MNEEEGKDEAVEFLPFELPFVDRSGVEGPTPMYFGSTAFFLNEKGDRTVEMIEVSEEEEEADEEEEEPEEADEKAAEREVEFADETLLEDDCELMLKALAMLVDDLRESHCLEEGDEMELNGGRWRFPSAEVTREREESFKEELTAESDAVEIEGSSLGAPCLRTVPVTELFEEREEERDSCEVGVEME